MSHKPPKIMAVEMRAVGMPYKEIAERLGVSLDKARKYVAAGRRVREIRVRREAKLYEEECNNRHFKAYQLQMLLPLLGFLKEIARDK